MAMQMTASWKVILLGIRRYSYYIKPNGTSGKPTKISAHEISAVEKVYDGQTGGSVEAYSILNGIATEL